jgi:imidazoleglycerol-phosphate dehydratase/histidinol-phosphatase
MQKILFIDRDGTINKEAPPSYQIDSFDKLEFYPNCFYYLRKIATELDYSLVLVTNQDGLGTPNYPEEKFWPIQNFIMKAYENEQVLFTKIHIDKTYPTDNVSTRKPGIGMMSEYINNPQYDLENSFMIGDRITDMLFAKNLGVKGIWINDDEHLGAAEIQDTVATLEKTIVLKTNQWEAIYNYLFKLNSF